jgi:hypothetical protein
VIRGDIDTTYQTQQRDMFASGLAGEIGMNALGVWLTIKAHADLQTGEAFPGVRRLMDVTGLASKTVQNALQTLQANHLLREARRQGRSIVYIARERLDVRMGSRVICTVVVDYVPTQMRDRLAKLQAAAAGDLEDEDVWAEVDILPGPGFTWDAERKSLRGRARADEVPAGASDLAGLPSDKPAVLDAREQLRQLRIEFAGKAKSPRNSQRRR